MALAAIAAFALACVGAPSAVAAPIADALPSISRSAGSYEPGEAIVRFELGASPEERKRARMAAQVDFDSVLELPRAQLVEVDGSVADAVRRLERQPGVAYAQPNYRYEALAVDPPNDTFFNRLWGLSDPALAGPGVSALEAWEKTKGTGQVIAIADTGVDLTHPDIVDNLWTNPSPTRGDLHGFDFVDSDGDPDDFNFHGTHVAGTAAATADNGRGIAGVAPEAEIMAVRVLDGDGSGTTADIADGITYAADNGADVINLSLGGPAGGDTAMSNAVDFAATQNVVVVAAAGNEANDNDSNPTTPCTLPQANLICVAALNENGRLAGFSNFGATSVDLAAPGTAILSTKTDYGSALLENGFETGTTDIWKTFADNGGRPWGLSSSAASGLQSATDSPGEDYGQAIDPSEFAVSELFTEEPVDLTGERGCRIHFQARYQVEEFFDFFVAGAFDEASSADFIAFTGTSSSYPGGFAREEVSISDLGGQNDVHPIFAVYSDELIEFDGAYVDGVRLFCRDETYIDGIAPDSQYDQPDVGNYVRFQGTSMAAPHVAGVAALVRAAAPGARAAEVIGAILQGASAMPSPEFSKPTATWGIADACQAIAVATRDATAVCPGSSRPVPPPSPAPTPAPAIESTAFSAPSVERDRTSPQTQITKKPPKVSFTREESKRLVFRFSSSEPGSSFLCKIDRGGFHQCHRKLVRWFRVGEHVLRVKARDAAGNVDRTPAVYRFTVKRAG